VNRLMRELGPMSALAAGVSAGAVSSRASARKGESLGSDDFSFPVVWSDASGCKEVSAAELTRELAVCSVAALMLAVPRCARAHDRSPIQTSEPTSRSCHP